MLIDVIAIEDCECSTTVMKKNRHYQLEDFIAAPLELEGKIRILREKETTAEDRLADAEKRLAVLEAERNAAKAEQEKLSAEVSKTAAKTDGKEATTTKAKK